MPYLHTIAITRNIIEITATMTPNTMFNYLSLDTAHVAETLGVMLQKERRIARINYFQKYSSSLLLLESSVDEVVNEQDRTKIVDWCYNCVDACNVDRECVALVSAGDMICDLMCTYISCIYLFLILTHFKARPLSLYPFRP